MEVTTQMKKMSTNRQTAIMQEAQPYLVQDIDALINKTVDQGTKMVRNNTMSAEVALSLWYKLEAYVSILKNMEKQIKMGIRDRAEAMGGATIGGTDG